MSTYLLRPNTDIDYVKLQSDLDSYFKDGSGSHFLVSLDELSFKPKRDYTKRFGVATHFDSIYVIGIRGKKYMCIEIYETLCSEVIHHLMTSGSTNPLRDLAIATQYDKAFARDVALTVMQSIYTRVDKSSAIRLTDESCFADMLVEGNKPQGFDIDNIEFIYTNGEKEV